MVVAGCSRRGGPLNNLPAGARPLKALHRGAGWRTGQGLESLGSAPWKVQPGALPSSPALSSHLVLSHNWLWQPSLLEISRKGECHSHSHNCHMALLSFSSLERNATTTNIKAIERGMALVLNRSKPHNPTKSCGGLVTQGLLTSHTLLWSGGCL